MIFVDEKTKLKYNTDKMELVSDKVEMEIGRPFRISVNAEIYRSKKGRWLGVAKWMDGDEEGRVLEENEVQQFLLKYDVGAYEKIFGKLEEA
jgi:hypothetical protein|nr:MAG TPA_asm: hypothetical protein [Caudoviricetes sp.]